MPIQEGTTRRATTAIIVIAFRVFSWNPSAATPVLGPSPGTFTDTRFYFTLQLPEDWFVEAAPESSTSLRLAARRPDGREIVLVYVFHAGGEVDLDKLSDLDEKLFSNLGERVSSKKTRKYFILSRSIERVYRSDRLTTRLSFRTDRTFGYVLAWRGEEENSQRVNEIIGSFHSSVPWKVAVKDKIPGAMRSAIRGVLLFAIPFGLGLLAFALRRRRVIAVGITGTSSLVVGYLVWEMAGWKLGLLAGGFVLVAMLLGMIGIAIWLEED